jgi:hypothetical protein
LNGNLIKKVNLSNQILINLKKKKRKKLMKRINNQKSFLNLERVEEKIVHFNK